MWWKMLKLRHITKSFYRKQIGNGRHTSFWYDRWSDRGVLADMLGERGILTWVLDEKLERGSDHMSSSKKNASHGATERY